jgi:hypothetical protein
MFDLNSASEAEQIAAVHEDVWSIELIESPTELLEESESSE